MKTYLFIFISVICLTACSVSQNNQNSISTEPIDTIIQTELDPIVDLNRIAIFEGQSDKKGTLSNQEINSIEVLLREALKNYDDTIRKTIQKQNLEPELATSEYDRLKIDISRYYRQYTISKNNLNDKTVTVFAFCKVDNDNWKDRHLMVNGGGACYFDFQVNLKKGTAGPIRTNGSI